MSQAFGQLLFKIRSYSPVPVIAAIAWILVMHRGALSSGGPGVETTLLALGIAACVLGQGLRAWVLGQVRDGTSGQGSVLEAVALNTAGPYAHVRNPLYVGNFLVCLGLALAAGDALAGALGLGFFAFEYAFIVPAEERFLREKFGAAYEAYCANVPRWLWRLAPAHGEPLSTRFDWRRALKKEHNPFAAWASGLFVLVGLRLWFREGPGAMPQLLALAGAEAALLVAYVLVKGWKHGWLLSARPSGDQ